MNQSLQASDTSIKANPGMQVEQNPALAGSVSTPVQTLCTPEAQLVTLALCRYRAHMNRSGTVYGWNDNFTGLPRITATHAHKLEFEVGIVYCSDPSECVHHLTQVIAVILRSIITWDVPPLTTDHSTSARPWRVHECISCGVCIDDRNGSESCNS